MTQLVTQAEAAVRLCVSLSTLRRLRKAGELRFIPGRPVKVPLEDVEAFIERKLCLDLTEATASPTSPTPEGYMKFSGLFPPGHPAAEREAVVIQRAKRNALRLSCTGRIGAHRRDEEVAARDDGRVPTLGEVMAAYREGHVRDNELDKGTLLRTTYFLEHSTLGALLATELTPLVVKAYGKDRAAGRIAPGGLVTTPSTPRKRSRRGFKEEPQPGLVPQRYPLRQRRDALVRRQPDLRQGLHPGKPAAHESTPCPRAAYSLPDGPGPGGEHPSRGRQGR